MTDKELNEIREKISCSQFGDDHYGEWGALTPYQRRTIKRMVDYIKGQNAEIDRLRAVVEKTDAAYYQKVDEINRLKAEVEELETEIDKQYEQAEANILGNMADGGTSCHWCIKKHKANAIKEFVDRLKKRYSDRRYDRPYAHTLIVVLFGYIDEIAKEVVGDNNG